MKTYQGQTLSWGANNGVIELELHRDPANEIGSLTLEELEKFAASLKELAEHNHALILHSSLKSGFSAGADLRELFERSQQMEKNAAARGVREFLERIHGVLNAIDEAPITTIAAVHGVTFGEASSWLWCVILLLRSNGPLLFSRTAPGIDFCRVWRHSATETRLGERSGPRFVAYRAKLQYNEGAAGWPGQPGRWGR